MAPRQSVLLLPVGVIVYLAIVNCVAALVLYGAVWPHESRRTDDPIWVSHVARTYCRYRQIGLSAAVSLERAIQDHDAWREQVITGGQKAARLIQSAAAELCPRQRPGSGQLP